MTLMFLVSVIVLLVVSSVDFASATEDSLESVREVVLASDIGRNQDSDTSCVMWAKNGECLSNPMWVNLLCCLYTFYLLQRCSLQVYVDIMH